MNLEQKLREAFQAGQMHGAVVFGGAQPLSGETPPNEDEYIGKAMREASLRRVIELVEGKEPTEEIAEATMGLGKEYLRRYHPTLYEQMLKDEEAAANG